MPAEAALHFPGGLRDSLLEDIGEPPRVLPQIWAGDAELPSGAQRPGSSGRSTWLEEGDGLLNSYCNTIPTARAGHTRPGSARHC